MRRWISNVVLVVTLLVVVLVMTRVLRHGEVTDTEMFMTKSFPVMGTVIAVQTKGDEIDRALMVVQDVFNDVDARMSEWKETSPLSRINAAAGHEPVEVPEDLRRVLERGIDIGDASDGAFDITWAALWGLWDFNAATPHVPDDEEIADRVARVDYRKLVIDDEAGTVFLPEEGMVIGLGGIAKGYALDRAAAALRTAGINNFLISGGGQMLAGGTKHGRLWRVGIRDPRGVPTDYFAMLELRNASMSTTGDYERYFILNGVRYHHILDPRTGRPARSGVRSVTVISGNAARADALSTALFVMGVERGLALAESTPDVEAVFVDDHGQVHHTLGLRESLQQFGTPQP